MLVMPALMVLVIGLAACSEKTPGNATGPDTTASQSSSGPFPTGTSSKPRTTSSSRGSSPVANVDPCSLLTDAEAAGLNAGSGKPDDSGRSRACVFDDAQGFSMTVTIYDNGGLGDISASGGKESTTIGRHGAVKYLNGITCGVAIKTSETSRVDVTSSADSDQRSCDIAMQVAQLVEKKLP